MAVEMCKLSLWLVSLDPKLPFSFVDDKILHGNSLLGLTDVEQLQAPAHRPGRGAALSRPCSRSTWTACSARRPGCGGNSPARSTTPTRSGPSTRKRRQWHRFQEVTAELTEIADAVVAAGLKLGGKPGRALNVAYENLGIALSEAYPSGLFDASPTATNSTRSSTEGLTPTVHTDYDRWKPLHWVIAVPDVMERGGFDAIIGNPPFLGGQKLTGAMGTNIRDWFVNVLANGKKGSADLVAYFFLRAMSLLNSQGNLGLIATNTVAQGDTREVGLRQMVDAGFTITRAIQSRSWPVATANLEYAAVWGTRGEVAGSIPRISDGLSVDQISTLLEPGRDVDPHRLVKNIGIAFQGCNVLGMGFTVNPTEASILDSGGPEECERSPPVP